MPNYLIAYGKPYYDVATRLWNVPSFTTGAGRLDTTATTKAEAMQAYRLGNKRLKAQNKKLVAAPKMKYAIPRGPRPEPQGTGVPFETRLRKSARKEGTQ